MDQPGNHILLRGTQPGAADRMRELLARTVQDHVTDQRSNAGALEDIRQRMEGLEWLVKEVREREVPGMTARLDGLAQHLDETTQRPPQWAESLAEHIELLRAQVAPVAELHSLWADVGTVSEHVDHALRRPPSPAWRRAGRGSAGRSACAAARYRWCTGGSSGSANGWRTPTARSARPTPGSPPSTPGWNAWTSASTTSTTG